MREVDGRGMSLQVGEPQHLFTAPVVVTNVPYDVTADGQEFIMNCRAESHGTNAINVVVNWTAEIQGK